MEPRNYILRIIFYEKLLVFYALLSVMSFEFDVIFIELQNFYNHFDISPIYDRL